MFFPERRLALLIVEGDTLHIRRFVDRNNDMTFEASVAELSANDLGYRRNVAIYVTDILKLEPSKGKA